MNEENKNINNEPIQPSTNPVNVVPSEPVQPSTNTPVTTNTTTNANQVDGSSIKTEGPRIQTSQNNLNAAAFNMKEKEKKAVQTSEERPKGLSVLLVLFLVGLILYAFFMPEISEFISAQKNKVSDNEVTTGQLRCELTDRSSKFTITNERNFSFKDNRVTGYSFETITKGNATKDEKELEELYNECMKLDMLVDANQVAGVDINCNTAVGTITKSEKVDLTKIDLDGFKTSYSEAGGTLPLDVSEGDNIDSVQQRMQSEKFTCSKFE